MSERIKRFEVSQVISPNILEKIQTIKLRFRSISGNSAWVVLLPYSQSEENEFGFIVGEVFNVVDKQQRHISSGKLQACLIQDTEL